MRLIGKIKNRQIFYISIREDSKWMNLLPNDNWLAFTIANNDDKDLINNCSTEIINNNVTYTCSAGELAELTEQYFDEEITLQIVKFKEKTRSKFNHDQSPITTSHRNFKEGFWFAATTANDGDKTITKVVCIDMTKRKVLKYLNSFIEKINSGWIPSDEEIKRPK